MQRDDMGDAGTRSGEDLDGASAARSDEQASSRPSSVIALPPPPEYAHPIGREEVDAGGEVAAEGDEPGTVDAPFESLSPAGEGQGASASEEEDEHSRSDKAEEDEDGPGATDDRLEASDSDPNSMLADEEEAPSSGFAARTPEEVEAGEDDAGGPEVDPDADAELYAAVEAEQGLESSEDARPVRSETSASVLVVSQTQTQTQTVAAVVDEVPELPPGVTPARHEDAPVFIQLELLTGDTAFRIRPEGDISLLATDIARLGQLTPIDVRPMRDGEYQVICGFRRLAALRFLQRQRVLARVHTRCSDDDALVMALANAIHARPVQADELQQVRTRFEAEGRLSPVTRDMLEKALTIDEELSPETVGEGGEEEIDADELAAAATMRLGEINQDLALLAGVFDALDESRRAQLLEQLRYSADLVAFLEGRE